MKIDPEHDYLSVTFVYCYLLSNIIQK